MAEKVNVANDKLAEMEAENEKCKELEISSNRLYATTVIQQISMNDVEQNSRKYCLTFHNIKFPPGTRIDHFTCMDKVIQICKAMGIKKLQNLDYGDFSACHILPQRKTSADQSKSEAESIEKEVKTTSIIAKFVNLHCAETIFFKRKLTKDFDDDTRAEIGIPQGKNIHISPNLTDLNRKVMKQAFELKNQMGWKFIWADCRGTIKVRQGDATEIKVVKCTEDIVELEGTIVLKERILC